MGAHEDAGDAAAEGEREDDGGGAGEESGDGERGGEGDGGVRTGQAQPRSGEGVDVPGAEVGKAEVVGAFAADEDFEDLGGEAGECGGEEDLEGAFAALRGRCGGEAEGGWRDAAEPPFVQADHEADEDPDGDIAHLTEDLIERAAFECGFVFDLKGEDDVAVEDPEEDEAGEGEGGEDGATGPVGTASSSCDWFQFGCCHD